MFDLVWCSFLLTAASAFGAILPQNEVMPEGATRSEHVPVSETPNVDEPRRPDFFARMEPEVMQEIQNNGINSLVHFLHYKFGSKIVGGEEARKGEFPFLASLELSRGGKVKQFCGGTVISRTFVLTAAHCVEWMNGKYSAMQVVLGEHNFKVDEMTEQRFRVRTIVIHENYDQWSLDNDIALILLDGVVEFNDFVRPLNLPRMSQSEPRGNASISGWGSTIHGGPGTMTLMKASVPIVSDVKCGQAYAAMDGNAEIMASHLCAGTDIGGIDTCQGDSGGPLVCEARARRTDSGEQDDVEDLDEVHDDSGETDDYGVVTGPYLCGVVSFGAGCGLPGIPGVYTQVSFYLNWIRRAVERFTDDDRDLLFNVRKPLIGSEHYPFLGVVSRRPFDLTTKHQRPEPCMGVLVADNLVITAGDCVVPFDSDESGSLWVGFGTLVTPGGKTFQRIPVSDWFFFDPVTYLREVSDDDDESMEATNDRHHDLSYRNRPVVLELAWSVVYGNDVYPANFGRSRNYVGMKADLVYLKDRTDSFLLRSTLKPKVENFQIVSPEDCKADYLAVYNLNESDVICAKRLFPHEQQPCHEFPYGSALVCHPGAPPTSETVNDDEPAPPSYNQTLPFLCGFVGHLHDDDDADDGRLAALPSSRSASRGGLPRVERDHCVFRKIWIESLADTAVGSVSNFTLAALGNPFFEDQDDPRP